MTEIELDRTIANAIGREHTSVQAGLQSLASAMHAYETNESIENVREMNAILWQENHCLKQQLGKSRRAAYWQFAVFFTVVGAMAWELGMGVVR